MTTPDPTTADPKRTERMEFIRALVAGPTRRIVLSPEDPNGGALGANRATRPTPKENHR